MNRRNVLKLQMKGTLFQAQCIRCGECMRACPTNTLQPAWLRAGPTGMFSPCLTPVRGPCEPLCTRCGDVCPFTAVELRHVPGATPCPCPLSWRNAAGAAAFANTTAPPGRTGPSWSSPITKFGWNPAPTPKRPRAEGFASQPKNGWAAAIQNRPPQRKSRRPPCLRVSPPPLIDRSPKSAGLKPA